MIIFFGLPTALHNARDAKIYVYMKVTFYIEKDPMRPR